MKVSQNDQIRMKTWFTSGFLMNGTELRSSSHFQILTLIRCSDLSRNLENWLILMFAFIPCETVKVSQDDQIRIQTWFRSRFLMNGTELRSFRHFQILTKIAYPHLSRNLENWLFLEFFFIHCNTVKLSQNDQIQMQTWFTSGFFMNGTELRSFSQFQILTKIAYPDLSRKHENWLFLEFSFIHCKTVKVSRNIKFESKLDLQVASWWIVQN